MKILINAGFGPSLANFRAPLIRALIGDGINVVAVAPDDSGSTEKEMCALGARYIPSHLRRARLGILADIRYMLELTRIIRDEKPDIIFSYSVKASIYGSMAAKLAGVRRVFCLISGLGYSFSGGKGLKKTILRKTVGTLMKVAFWCCRGVFFQNPDDVADLRAMGVIGRGVVVHVVNGSGVDRKQFSEQPLPKPVDGKIVYLLIARLINDKGVCEFVEAIRQLKDRCPVRGVLVAPPDDNPAAISIEQARKWQADGIVEYVEWAKDVRPFLRDCHVFVLPSTYREGVPRTILEALAVGRPVITTDSPGCRETIKLTARGRQQRESGAMVMEGENGLLLRTRNVDAVAAAIEQLALDPGLIEQMSRNSLELACNKYDVNIVNKSMLDVILERH